MKITVLVPSFRRPVDLERCLKAVATQVRAAHQVLVVARVGDEQTAAVATKWKRGLPLEIVDVTTPGVVQALNAGLASCSGDIVAITDDDAAPRGDWLFRIEAHFSGNPKLGGVGGRDWIFQDGKLEAGSSREVGKVRWYGRVVGNHHLGVGPARQVDSLKGVNCAFRMAALRPIGFDTRLHGDGAQVHWELCLCFAIKCAGWQLVYDPAIAVDHFPAPRYDKDERGSFNATAAADQRYNFRLAIGSGLPVWRCIMVLAWLHVIGTKSDPGFLRLAAMLFRGDRLGLSRHRSVQRLLVKKN